MYSRQISTLFNKCLILLCCLNVSVAYSQIGVEQLPVPQNGFEGQYTVDGRAPTWFSNPNTTFTSVTFSKNTSDPNSGLAAQQIDFVDDPAQVGKFTFTSTQKMDIKRGKAYRFSIWLKGVNLTGNQVHLRIRQNTAPHFFFDDTLCLCDRSMAGIYL